MNENKVPNAGDWLNENINILEELIKEHRKGIEPKKKPKQTYSITLMKNNFNSNKSITIITDNEYEIKRIKGFISKIDCYYSNDIENVRYLFPQKSTQPLCLGDELYYEYSVIKTDKTYETEDIEMTYEKYLRCIADSMNRLNFYKGIMSIWERIVLRREIRSIARLNTWYNVYILDGNY